MSKLDQIRALREDRFAKMMADRQALAQRAREFVEPPKPAWHAPKVVIPRRKPGPAKNPVSAVSLEPWKAQGISRRTYYRRRKIFKPFLDLEF